MKLTDDEIKRLNSIFSRLWGNRNGVAGSWGEASFRYHPTFIRRGPLLLSGETQFSGLWVLSPPDCKVTPIHGNSCVSMSVFPRIEGKAIKVSRTDDGPWNDLLRTELPKMEEELNHSKAIKEAENRRKSAAEAADHQREISEAAESLKIYCQGKEPH